MKKYINASYDYSSMIHTIFNIISEEAYDFYGLRADWNNYSVGDVCEPSHQWWQDDPEDDSPYIEDIGFWDGGELDGTCAVEIKTYDKDMSKIFNSIEHAIKLVCESYRFTFSGESDIILIGGDLASNGNDVGEIIIEDAVVLHKF